MSTLMLSSQCESVFAKVIESLLTNNAPVENTTSCEDVWIVGIICLAVFLVVLVAAFTILTWKAKDIKSKEPTKSTSTKGNENSTKYVEKLLDFLQGQTKEFGEKGEFKRYKTIDSIESKMYYEVLTCLIDAQQQEDKIIKMGDLKRVLNIQTGTQKDNQK